MIKEPGQHSALLPPCTTQRRLGKNLYGLPFAAQSPMNRGYQSQDVGGQNVRSSKVCCKNDAVFSDHDVLDGPDRPWAHVLWAPILRRALVDSSLPHGSRHGLVYNCG